MHLFLSLWDRLLAVVGLCRRSRLTSAETAASRLAIAQRHAHQAQARNRAILRAMPDLMFLHDAQGVFIDYYARDPKMLLMPAEQFMGRSMRDVLPPELAASLESCFREATASGNPVVHPYTLERGNSVEHYEARIVRCDDGTILSIVRDQTAQKDGERQLTAAYRGLARQWRLMGLADVTSSLARELNQPLTAVLSNAQMAVRTLNNAAGPYPEIREALQDVIVDARRAAELMQEARSLFVPQSGECAPVSVNTVLRAAHGLAAVHLETQRVVVRLELAEDVPRVLANRGQLQLVVLQLIMNATDALAELPAGVARVLAMSSRVEQDRVHVCVADTGPGIDEENADRLFDPLYTTKADGVGIGLTASRTIIEAHGGSMWAAANGTSGAAFHFTLPVAHT